MRNCIVKVLLPFILIIFFLSMFIFANFRPDSMKQHFSDFIDILQINKTTTQSTYTRGDKPYLESSAFENQ